jgi:hypothetical protein
MLRPGQPIRGRPRRFQPLREPRLKPPLQGDSSSSLCRLAALKASRPRPNTTRGLLRSQSRPNMAAGSMIGLVRRLTWVPTQFSPRRRLLASGRCHPASSSRGIRPVSRTLLGPQRCRMKTFLTRISAALGETNCRGRGRRTEGQ